MKKFLSFFMALLIAMSVIVSSSVVFAAEDSSQYPFDASTVEQDLSGVAFKDIFNVEKAISVHFLEYAYSATGEDFALYLYIYNPMGLGLDEDNEDNCVQLAYSFNSDGDWHRFGKYKLKFCAKTSDDLIYKYRIEGEDIHSYLNSASRTYQVSSVELVIDRKIKDFSIGRKYEFTGFAKGYGSNESTLRVSMTEFETISLEVGHTHYRVQTENVGEYEDIQSVYFNIPNSYIQKYGDIYSLSAVWQEALTTPILVINNKELVSNFEPLLRTDVTDGQWGLMWDFTLGTGDNYEWSCNNGYNVISNYNPVREVKSISDRLDYCFYSSADFVPENTLVTSSRLMSYLKKCNYDKALFEKIDNTHYDLYDPEEFIAKDLNTVERFEVANWWQRMFSFGSVKMLKEKDVNFTTIEKIDASLKDEDDQTFAKKYYVQEDDVLDIQNTIKSDETTYLFRYTVTDYYAWDDVYICENSEPIDFETEYEAMIAQTTAILDFDIIDITFYNEGEYTTLAAVSDPTDYISNITYPTTLDPNGNCICEENCFFCEGDCENNCDCWLKYIAMLLAILIILVIFAPFMPYVISFVAKLVSLVIQFLLLPFKVIANLLKNRKNKNE